MLTNISWKEYSIFILLLIFSYYIIILIVFYKREIVNLINNLHLLDKGSNIYNESHSLEKSKSDLHIDNPESSDVVNHLQEEIKSQLERAKIKKAVREEIIMSLKSVLQNYNSIKQSPYKDSINNYIKAVCENLCSIHLNDKEIDQLWFR
jgi:hypothetical protein